MQLNDLKKVQELYFKNVSESSSKLTAAWADAVKSTGVEDMLENYRALASRTISPPVFWSVSDSSSVADKLQEIIATAAQDLPRLVEARGRPEKLKEIADQWTRSYQGLLRQVFGLPKRSELGRFAEKWRSLLISLSGEPPGHTEALFPDFFSLLMAPYLPAKPSPMPNPFQLWAEASEKALSGFFPVPRTRPEREHRQKAKKALDAQQEFLRMLPGFQEEVLEGFQKAVERIVTNILQSINRADIDRLDSDSYKKFFRIWISHNEEVFLELFKSERFSRALAETLDAGLEARKRMDSLTADWFSFFNIPTGKDMEEVYKALHDLTEKNRSLETEVGELKTALTDLANRLQQMTREPESE